MHDQYGSVVRTGPRSISISDKNMIKEVLATQDLPKGSQYSILGKIVTMISTRDKNFHKQRVRVY
jgi:hypothetical protein